MTASEDSHNIVWHRTLAFKVAVAACAILALSAILLTGAALLSARNIVRGEIHERLRAVATDRQQMILAYSGQQQERAALVASRTQLRKIIQEYIDGSIDIDALREQTRPILDDALRSADGFVDIWICDPAGRVITATDDEYLDANYSSDPTFEMGTRQEYLGDLRWIDNEHHARLAAPARTDHGRLIAVVMVLVDATPLVDILQKSEGLGATGEVLIATREGDQARLLLPSRGQSTPYVALTNAPVMAAALRGEASDAPVETVFSGVDVLAEYQPIRFQDHSDRPWGLVAQVDVAEAYQPIRALALEVSLIGVGVLALAVGASIMLTVMATRPLRTLTSTAMRIAAGDLDARAAVTSRDECGVLTQAFNQMTDHLVALHADLERRVERRTEELSHSERKFQKLFESSRDAIVVLTNGHFVDANGPALGIFGCKTVEEICRLGPVELSPVMQPCGRSSSELAREHIDRALREGSDFFEWVHRRTDGTQFTAEVLLSRVVETDEGVLLQASIRDIEERKQANDALRHSEERFELAMRGSSDGLWDWNLNTDEVYYSPRWKSMLGYDDDELDVQLETAMSLIHPDDKQRVLDAIDVYQSDPAEKFEVELRMRHKEGHYVHILSRGFLVRQDSDGRPVRMVGTHVDLTERKQGEQALLNAKNEADRASQAKSQFLASMSHELRTPLNGVIGMTELLADTELNERQRQFVEACHNSGESLLSLINDILDFSKIEAGKLDLDVHNFDLEKLVTDTTETMAWRAAEKDLEVPCYFDQMSRLVLEGDSNRLRQVLVNLLGNAVKFTEVGEVAVRTGIVARQNDQIRIRCSVSDTGIGIPSDKLGQLFQSFSQVDATTTRHYGGTGLGLAISQSLVELMGGTIGVESEEQVGSTFWFELPFVVVSESPDDTPDTSPLAGRRALIVDDNETNRVILAEYAAGWGMQSVTTASVDAALAAVAQNESIGRPFEFVLTDFHMPHRNGLDLARVLNDALKEPAPRIVLLSSSTDIYEASTLRELGIHASLRKPLRRHELHDVLCGLLRQTANASDPDTELSATVDRAQLSGHVLLAEDNSINRMYVVELMKQLGCTCDTVANGCEALEAVRQCQYDLVLMDCQMPEMDGFETTRRIRQMEADGTRDGHLPVVALTANAVKGDRQRCLDAGMDDYLSKPVNKQQVVNVLEKLLDNTQSPSPDTVTTVATTDADDELSGRAPIDAESLLARCFGSLEFAGSLLDEWEATGMQRVENIRQSASEQDAASTADAAHALKGAAGILCADAVQNLAESIEQAGRSSSIQGIQGQIRDLAAEMQRCLNYVPQLRQDLTTLKEGV